MPHRSRNRCNGSGFAFWRTLRQTPSCLSVARLETLIPIWHLGANPARVLAALISEKGFTCWQDRQDRQDNCMGVPVLDLPILTAAPQTIALALRAGVFPPIFARAL